MPELPEVETVARQLHPKLRGKRIVAVQFLDQRLKLTPRDAARLTGRRITRVWRIGKEVAFELAQQPGGNSKKNASPPLFMLVHLRMTGRLVYSAGPIPPETKYLRAIFELERGRFVFQDTRRFGTIRFCGEIETCTKGIDPLAPEFTPEAFGAMLRNAPTLIKPWLLRQDKLPGMGNIYASESLFLAGIKPQRRARTLKRVEIDKLHAAIQQVLRDSIAAGGTTFSDFRDGHGKSGNFVRRLRVYDREGAPCYTCDTPIKRLVQAQRSTFFCPHCQH